MAFWKVFELELLQLIPSWSFQNITCAIKSSSSFSSEFVLLYDLYYLLEQSGQCLGAHIPLSLQNQTPNTLTGLGKSQRMLQNGVQ